MNHQNKHKIIIHPDSECPMKELICQLRDVMEHELNDYRFVHTMGVANTAAALAVKWDADLEQALVAGMLHDCAKNISIEAQIKLSRKFDLPLSEAELHTPSLIHAPLGACLAKEKYGITDKVILDAIRYHTTGRPQMTLLEKIIYVADYMEPTRNATPARALIRKEAFENLDLCVYHTAKNVLGYLEQTGDYINDMTRQTCAYYERETHGNK